MKGYIALCWLGISELLTGCMGLGLNPQAMSADQIKAAVADKSVSAVCAKILGPWGTAETTVVTFDQKVISNGGVTVGDKCTVTVTDSHPVVQPATPVINPPRQ